MIFPQNIPEEPFLLVGSLETAVGLLCFFVKNASGLAATVLWLAVNLAVCQASLSWMGVNGGGTGYFDCVNAAFALPARSVQLMINLMVAYLLIGSLLALIWLRHEKHKVQVRASQLASGELLKICCPACGGHIAFSAGKVGQEIPCPHCRTCISLRKAELLKMSCFFCKENIEFPPYAIGTKMACPHCRMDITLKDPS